MLTTRQHELRADVHHQLVRAALAANEDVEIALRIGGHEHWVVVEPRTTLLDTQRERLGITSPRKSCGHGQCGACTVLRGTAANEQRFRRTGDAEPADAQPLPGNAFKASPARNVIAHTLLELPEERR
ncbi:2Fe-2S iron-sulfur cluster-binding protein [Saccharopolyspora sp. NPDC050389]|uniref:2Fe-2S iron-sulfur cluster-binding protein n=1 Tax=Saccharopolyspora sp. NPDC050389 TaxID=3155516 RepID=UPI0033E6122A